MIIMIGIIARLPSAIIEEFVSAWSGAEGGGFIMFLFEILALLAVMALAILLVKATRKVPVQYAKRVEGNRQVGGARQYIPLKLFAANVMPIIFAQAIMFIPLTLSTTGDGNGFFSSFRDYTSIPYNVVYVALIVAFTYFYTAITLNPVQMSEDMKRNNGFIPGIKPGKNTADYLDKVMTRLLLPGSLFIAIIAIMPAFAGLFGVKQSFAQFFGGTSLLILVGVVLDTIQQVQSHLLVRRYDGLLNSGHTRSRGASVSAY
jgi:preprotein translocase subunit SecY